MDYSFAGALLRVAIFLPIVAGLAYFTIKLGISKKYAKTQGTNIKVIEQAPLTPKSSLSIVKVGEKYLLLGITENAVNLLTDLDNYQEEESGEENSSFADFLNRFKGGDSKDE